MQTSLSEADSHQKVEGEVGGAAENHQSVANVDKSGDELTVVERGRAQHGLANV